MRKSTYLPLLGALLLAIQPAVQAQPAMKQMTDQYQKMCMSAVNIPAPDGESDLKGNPKLGAYCDCFAEKFLARAMQASTASAKSGKPPTQSLDESTRQELAMRQECRQKTGLPRPPSAN